MSDEPCSFGMLSRFKVFLKNKKAQTPPPPTSWLTKSVDVKRAPYFLLVLFLASIVFEFYRYNTKFQMIQAYILLSTLLFFLFLLFFRIYLFSIIGCGLSCFFSHKIPILFHVGKTLKR